MKAVLVLALFSGAAAFVPQQAPKVSRSAATSASVKDMDGILPPVGFFDPLGLSSEADEATLGWYRHAEIKHGRVAMAAFVGWVVESNFHTPLTLSTSKGLKFTDLSMNPFEAWDQVPLNGKIQIICVISFLEWWGEFALDTHYTKGGKPGVYPSFTGSSKGGPPHFAPDLFQPFFKTIDKMPEDVRAKRRTMELQNGRAAMLGIMSVVAASTVPGSVPALAKICAPYSGNIMAPFSADFSLF